VARHITDLTMFAWLISGADDFDLTVTATGAVLGDEPAVTGVRVGETAEFTTPLPRATASRLGLPADVDISSRASSSTRPAVGGQPPERGDRHDPDPLAASAGLVLRSGRSGRDLRRCRTPSRPEGTPM